MQRLFTHLLSITVTTASDLCGKWHYIVLAWSPATSNTQTNAAFRDRLLLARLDAENSRSHTG